jgi:hypothetical protein
MTREKISCSTLAAVLGGFRQHRRRLGKKATVGRELVRALQAFNVQSVGLGTSSKGSIM